MPSFETLLVGRSSRLLLRSPPLLYVLNFHLVLFNNIMVGKSGIHVRAERQGAYVGVHGQLQSRRTFVLSTPSQTIKSFIIRLWPVSSRYFGARALCHALPLVTSSSQITHRISCQRLPAHPRTLSAHLYSITFASQFIGPRASLTIQVMKRRITLSLYVRVLHRRRRAQSL